MHNLHYHHLKEFKEAKFKKWSTTAKKLMNKYTDNQIEEFKIELKKLSDTYWKI